MNNSANIKKEVLSIEQWIEQTINQLLDAPIDRPIARNINIYKFGMDSVTTMQLQCAIEDQYPDIMLDYDTLMEGPTISNLARYIQTHAAECTESC